MAETISHWIDGSPEPGNSGRSGPVYDPVTGKERARVAFASVEEVDRAVAAASAAFCECSIYGPEGVHFYTRPEVVTSHCPDPVHRGVDLGFPRSR